MNALTIITAAPTDQKAELNGILTLIGAETAIWRSDANTLDEQCGAADRVLEQQARAAKLIEAMTGQSWSRIEGAMS